MLSKPLVESNEQQEQIEIPEDNSWKEIFINMDKDWEKAIPSESPLLSIVKKPDFEINAKIKQWFAAVNIAMLPFHHLISLEKIVSAHILNPSKNPHLFSKDSRTDRLQYFWQMIAAADVSAGEATLLDDSLRCHFMERVDGQPVEIDWEVLFYDELGGCAEVYRAEMFLVKRHVHEAGIGLRSVIELTSEDFAPYLAPEMFASLGVEDVNRLFMNNWFAPFSLTISGTIKKSAGITELESAGKINQQKKSQSPETEFNSYRKYAANRVETWITREEEDSDDEESSDNISNTSDRLKIEDKSRESESVHSTIRATLTTYWLDWQRSALAAGFDFDYLESLNDICAIRFYELTKLWRASLIINAGDKLPAKLEIGHDKFACLMPLPHLKSVQEINSQIRQLIKPLKASGYVKSFAVKTDWRGIESRAVQLIFRFGD